MSETHPKGMPNLESILSQAERLLELDERVRRDCGGEHPQAKFLTGMLTREGWDAELATLLASAPEMAALLRRLLPVVKAGVRCADDLEAEVRARYGAADGPVHPALMRRYARDLEPVECLRAALTAAQEVEHG